VARSLGAPGRSRAEGRRLSPHVRAAGGVVTRGTGEVFEVLLVHRPQYDDWTFPKGKVEEGESDEECALREVEEETGLRCVLGDELPPTFYADAKGRPKTVRYWEMTVAGGELRFDFEVDEARWVTSEAAAALLTYPRDLDLLEAAGSRAGPLRG